MIRINALAESEAQCDFVHAWQLQVFQWLATFCLEINHMISSLHIYIEVTILYAHPEMCWAT